MWRTRFGRLLATALDNFAPLLIFWALDLTLGLKPAIAGTVVLTLFDAGRRLWRGHKLTRLYLLICALTVVFGAIDLLSATPFMLKYEAVITNVITGCIFVVGARGPKTIVQELAEQRQGANFSGRPDISRFFQLFTLIWAGYFFIKAAVYLAVGMMFPFGTALAIRSVLGSASLIVLSALSFTQGRRLFALFKRLGWLPPAQTPQSAPET